MSGWDVPLVFGAGVVFGIFVGLWFAYRMRDSDKELQ